MSELDAELADLFRDEAVGRLDQMDMALLGIESGAAGAESVDSLFRNAHTIKGAAGMVGFDDVRVLAHAVEDILASVRETGVFPPELAVPLLRATAVLRAQVTSAAQVPDNDLLDDLAASLATLSDRRAEPPETGPPETGPHAAVPSPADPSPAVSPAAVSPAAAAHANGVPETSQHGQAERQPGKATRGSSTQRRPLRVPAEKIDHLLDVVGELMQYRGRLAHALGGQTELSQSAADVLTSGERMLADLKDTAIGMRTLPLAVITGRLPRAVRDLARVAGKDVEFVVTGADTELDRVIIESLSEPLTHLLRNAVIHGIEAPPDRERAGKPARGRLELRAVPRGSLVEIVVADDGSGISLDVIEQARREGSLAEVLARPGYSTAAEVTDLAGRGVGLDAVKSYAQALGGSLEVRSQPGHGLDVVLMLPLALALLEVLLFERGAAVYGVPLVVVEEVVTVAQTLRLEGRPAMEVRGRPVPVADIAALIGAAAPPSGRQPPALVISAASRRVVATCDRVLGAEEVVVKPLGPFHRGAGSYLGTAILGDGRIALLLEPASLTGEARRAPAMTSLSGEDPRRADPPGADRHGSGEPEADRHGAGQPGGHRHGRDRPGTDPHRTDPAEANLAGPAKVLVVEDSFTVRELQRSILEAAGYPVVTARDGRDALEILGRDAEIALVVTDLEMPELDGLDLTRAIRADRARSSLPVIIVTARGSEEDRRRGIKAGADAYMAKQSFDQQALLGTVERLVGR